MASLQAGRRRVANPSPGRAAQLSHAAAAVTATGAADARASADAGPGPAGALAGADAASALASGLARPGYESAQPGAGAAALGAASIGVLLAAAGAAAPDTHGSGAAELPTPDALAAALAELPADVQACQAPPWLWACMPDLDQYGRVGANVDEAAEEGAWQEMKCLRKEAIAL